MHYVAYIILRTGRENATCIHTEHEQMQETLTDIVTITSCHSPFQFLLYPLLLLLLLLVMVVVVVVAVVSSYSTKPTIRQLVFVSALCVNTRQLAAARSASKKSFFFSQQPANNEQAKINFFCTHFAMLHTHSVYK